MTPEARRRFTVEARQIEASIAVAVNRMRTMPVPTQVPGRLWKRCQRELEASLQEIRTVIAELEGVPE